MKIAFLVNDLQLSGGIGVVVQHARRLSLIEGWDVTLVLVRDDEEPSWHGYEHLTHLHVRTRAEAMEDEFDVAVATWWETVFTLFELSAERYAYFVQSLEDRFYRYDESGRLGAGLTLDLPVAFITEARWILDTLAALRPDASCHLVPNGIDKQIFTPLEQVPPSDGGPLRVLVEGSPDVWHKRVAYAVTAARAMREPHTVTLVSGAPSAAALNVDRTVGPLSHPEMAALYAEHDVVLKLSCVEGMFGPPLEGFHRGATCVVTPVTGHEEYVEHGYNGLVTDWDDPVGTARQLDLLARDRTLLQRLRAGALETARAWPDWDRASRTMADALMAIAHEPRPDGARASLPLAADLRAGLEAYQGRLQERSNFFIRARRFERRLERITHGQLARVARRVRWNPALRLALRPLRPLYRRLRDRL